MRLENKIAIVTGSSKGIGKAIALEFARNGAAVVVTGRNPERTQQTVYEIEETGGNAIAVVADVASLEDTNRLIQKTLETYGKVDILVNNAGIAKDNLLMRMKEAEWDEVLNVNLKSAFNCIKSVTRQMMKQREGCIINITSVVGQTGNAGQANYAASKAGMIGLTKAVAKELGSRHITCNAIAPGFIKTDMTETLDEKVKEALLQRIPLGRFGSVEEVAGLAVFLACKEASYITGQVLNVDGGMVIN